MEEGEDHDKDDKMEEGEDHDKDDKMEESDSQQELKEAIAAVLRKHLRD